MEDNQIIDLYFSRDLTGLAAAQEKYTPYCHTVSVNILGSSEDAEECVNDTFFRSWEAIPPHRPKTGCRRRRSCPCGAVRMRQRQRQRGGCYG